MRLSSGNGLALLDNSEVTFDFSLRKLPCCLLLASGIFILLLTGGLLVVLVDIHEFFKFLLDVVVMASTCVHLY